MPRTKLDRFSKNPETYRRSAEDKRFPHIVA